MGMNFKDVEYWWKKYKMYEVGEKREGANDGIILLYQK